MAQTREQPDYLDLENPSDQAKLEDAGAYLRARANRLIVIEEVQRAPGLFQVVRGVIDENIRAGRETGQFLLLGSASIELLKQSSESLAGRIAYLELGPIDVTEIPLAKAQALWVRGGFPLGARSTFLNGRCFATEQLLVRGIPSGGRKRTNGAQERTRTSTMLLAST